MLTDRRVLLEQEIAKLKQECDKLYFKIVSGNATGMDKMKYVGMRAELSDQMSDLLIFDHMIEDGHE